MPGRCIYNTTYGWIEASAYCRKPPPSDHNRTIPANREKIQDSFSKDRPVLLGWNPTLIIPDDTGE